MKKIYLTIATFLLLTGCSNYINEDQKTSFFEENNKCFSYAEGLYEQYDYEIEGRTEGGSVESVFYSPKVDSCLYIYVTYIDLNVHSRLVDVFTNETLLEEGGFVSDFKEKVKNLGYIGR
jgi:hypothetical protein